MALVVATTNNVKSWAATVGGKRRCGGGREGADSTAAGG